MKLIVHTSTFWQQSFWGINVSFLKVIFMHIFYNSTFFVKNMKTYSYTSKAKGRFLLKLFTVHNFHRNCKFFELWNASFQRCKFFLLSGLYACHNFKVKHFQFFRIKNLLISPVFSTSFFFMGFRSQFR